MAKDEEFTQEFDEDVASKLIGSVVLVGMTYLHPDGEFDRQEQLFGRVVKANATEGIGLQLEGSRAGEFYWLPPATNVLKAADPGEYTLRSTGETVSDPDFLCQWTMTAAARQ
jgi:hypothetical protein